MFNCMGWSLMGRCARLTARRGRCNRREALLGQCLDRATWPGQAAASPKTSQMTYHAELAPRRRPWLIATPLILVLVLAAAWSGVWYYTAREAEARVNDWQAQQASAGRVFSCGSQKVGGFPFRIEVRCGDAAVELKDTQPPLA